MVPQHVVEVIGRRESKRITATIDTGFDGCLCLPIKTAVELGLELAGQTTVELADGTQHGRLVFRGRVKFLDIARDVPILLTESEDALVGTKLLEGTKLTIDFDTQRVHIQPKKRLRKER
jgi:clan AA aspartic protease